MEVILFASSSEKERVDKTSYLSEIGTYEGFLRAPSSVINPTIQLELGDLTANALADEDNVQVVDGDSIEIVGGTPRITDANYMYIPEFGRYYFINDISCHINGLFLISGVCDVLMSWKENIKTLNCYVERNEFTYKRTEQDELLPLKFIKNVTEIIPPTGSLVNVEMGLVSDMNMIITFVTDEAKYKNLNFPNIEPPMSGIGLDSFDPDKYATYSTFLPYAMTQTAVMELGAEIIEDDTLASYVRTIVALPFFIPDWLYQNEQVIHKGHYNPNNPTASAIWISSYKNVAPHYLKGRPLSSMSPYLVVADFVVPNSVDFLDYQPYTHFEIYLPFLGYVELNYQAIANHRIIVYYSMSYEDGSGNVYVYDITAKRMVFSNACQIGIKLAFNTTNSKENATQRNSANINLALNMLGSLASIGIGVATENPIAIAGGVLKGAGAIAGYANTNMNIFDRASVSFGDAVNALYAQLNVKYRVTRTSQIIPTLDMDKYAHACGRPLREMRSLATLSGFTIAKSVHLDGVPCYAGEADEIIKALATGVIL